LHFRNLALFLWPTTPRDKDVLARHFVTETWEKSRPPGLDDLVHRADREVAHLTTHRLPANHERKRWQFEDCIKALLPMLHEFVGRADSSKLPPRVPEELARLHNLLDDRSAMIRLKAANYTTSITRRLEVLE